MIVILYCFCILLPFCQACPKGGTISSVTLTQSGNYNLNFSESHGQMSASPAPGEQCGWTDLTCDAYGAKKGWNKEEQTMSNLYMDLDERRKTVSSNMMSAGSVLHLLTIRPYGESTALHFRLYKRCCQSSNTKVEKCQSVEWSPKGGQKFDVAGFAAAKLKCEGTVRDMSVKTPKVTLEICCLKRRSYDKNHEVGKDAATAITLAVALPLALGIGIPLLLTKPPTCLQKILVPYDLYDQVDVLSSGIYSVIKYFNGLNHEECACLCIAATYDYCSWSDVGFQSVATTTPETKTWCTMIAGYVGSTSLVPENPGLFVYIRKGYVVG